MKLVIAEKPSVGAALAKALGAREKKKGYIGGDDLIVSWCVGHLVELVITGTTPLCFIVSLVFIVIYRRNDKHTRNPRQHINRR